VAGLEDREQASGLEMLSFGGAQFASSIYMAFSSYYLMMFCLEVALIPAAATAVLLFCLQVFAAFDDQAISLFINRWRFKDGKYRPYFKWCALPFAISLAALGLAPDIGVVGRVAYVALALLLCEVSWSALRVASMAMLPYLARGDVRRAQFISCANASSIFAYIVVGACMLPLADFLGNGNMGKGFALTLALFAAIAAPLHFNAYFRLSERHYGETRHQPTIRDMLSAIGRNRRIVLFMLGYGLYSMADAFKSLTTYYYAAWVMARPDLLPAIILAGLISPLAVQPLIPRLLAYAGKEALINFGLFAATCASLLMLAAGARPYALIACVALYGVCTAIVANLVFTVVASFADEMRQQHGMNISEILTATLGLAASLGVALASGAAPVVLAASGYSPQAAHQPSAALTGITALYVGCTAAGMALAGLAVLAFRKRSEHLRA